MYKMWNIKIEEGFLFQKHQKEVNVYNVRVSDKKNGEIKIMTKLKIIKNTILKTIEKKYAINRKIIMMRIVM